LRFGWPPIAATRSHDARVSSPAATDSSVLQAGDIRLDLYGRKCRRKNRGIELNVKEFRLPEAFLRFGGRVPTRNMLLEKVWDLNFDPTTSVVETHVSRMRGKIKKPFGDTVIQTIRGAGYVFEPKSPA